MSTPVNRGGKEIVAEGFPPEAYEELHTRIWRVGQLLMPTEFDLVTVSEEPCGPMLPATLTLPAYAFDERDPEVDEDYMIGSLMLELSLHFGASKATEALLLGCAATISEVEPYVYPPYEDADLELWTSLGVKLEPRGRRVKFSRETSIRSETAKILIPDHSPLPGRSRSADPAWLAARRLAQGTDVDYRWMVNRLDTMLASPEQPQEQAE